MKGTEPCPRTGRKSNAISSEIAFDFLPVPIRIAFKSLMKGTESVKLFKKLERGEFLFGPPTTILDEKGRRRDKKELGIGTYMFQFVIPFPRF